MADAFEDRVENCYGRLAELGEGGSFENGKRLQAPAENRYAGFDAYKKVIDSGVDVVILATPPGFRPEHFEYAVEQGKHVFMEKPVAVDAPGVRRVLKAAKASKEAGLKVGVGLQRHHSAMYNETIQRIHDGAIGDVVALRVYWNGSGVWVRARKPEQTEMEYQMRNWYYFNWLCGDHIVEQHIHNIDVGNWVKGGHPVEAQGQGGRQWRNGPDHGEIFDHHFVEYTYDDGAVMLSQCRHIQNCWDEVAEYAHGSKGRASLASGLIEAPGGWNHREPEDEKNPYQVEHDRLFEAIREDKPFNEAKRGAIATMTSVMGRMATYSRQEAHLEGSDRVGRVTGAGDLRMGRCSTDAAGREGSLRGRGAGSHEGVVAPATAPVRAPPGTGGRPRRCGGPHRARPPGTRASVSRSVRRPASAREALQPRPRPGRAGCPRCRPRS